MPGAGQALDCIRESHTFATVSWGEKWVTPGAKSLQAALGHQILAEQRDPGRAQFTLRCLITQLRTAE